jgi:hypothetical protein
MGEKTNCIAAQAEPKIPTISAARAVLPSRKCSMSFGKTATMMPMLSLSGTTVKK